MIRGWMGGFDSIGSYSARNHTEEDMISWREALVPISIFCNPVLWFLVGFLLISCCRDEKGFWQCPCRRRRGRSSESTKTSTTNISTLNHGSSGGLSSQLDLELGLRLTGGSGGLAPSRSGSLRQPAVGGRARRVARARSAQLLSSGPPRSLPSSAVPLHTWRGSAPKLSSAGRGRAGPDGADRAAEPPPFHILVTPAELHGPAPAAAGSLPRPAGGAGGLTAPARPLRRSLDDRTLRPRPSRRSLEEHRSWEHGSGPERQWSQLPRHGSRQDICQQPHTSPRQALLQQHVRHISLQKLPPLSAPPPRPVSLHDSHPHLQTIPLEMSPMFHSSPQKERIPMYQPSPWREQPPLYQCSPQEAQFELGTPDNPASRCPAIGPGSPLTSAVLDPAALYRVAVVPPSPSDPPGRPKRVSLQEVRLAPVTAAPRRPQRVSLQELGVHDATTDVRRRGRKSGVFGHHPAAQSKPWTLDLDELTEK